MVRRVSAPDPALLGTSQLGRHPLCRNGNRGGLGQAGRSGGLGDVTRFDVSLPTCLRREEPDHPGVCEQSDRVDQSVGEVTVFLPPPQHDRVENVVEIRTSQHVQSAAIEGDKAVLECATAHSARQQLVVDHVLAATGYRVDVDAVSFLDSDVRSSVKRVAGFPALLR